MTVEELLAREEIRQLLATYTISGDQGRLDDLGSVFTPDGALERSRGRFVGPEAIKNSLKGVRTDKEGPNRPMEFVRHNLTTSLVTFDDPETARGRTYFIVFSEVGPDHMGLYLDRFVKADGRWQIAERTVRIDWAAENGHSQATRPARESGRR